MNLDGMLATLRDFMLNRSLFRQPFPTSCCPCLLLLLRGCRADNASADQGEERFGYAYIMCCLLMWGESVRKGAANQFRMCNL